MPIFSISTLRAGLGDTGSRVYTVVGRRPSLVGRILAGAAALAIIVLAVAVLLLLLIPAIVILAVALVSHTIRRALSATRQPNGVLDGRRNVRVVTPDQN